MEEAWVSRAPLDNQANTQVTTRVTLPRPHNALTPTMNHVADLPQDRSHWLPDKRHYQRRSRVQERGQLENLGGPSTEGPKRGSTCLTYKSGVGHDHNRGGGPSIVSTQWRNNIEGRSGAGPPKKKKIEGFGERLRQSKGLEMEGRPLSALPMPPEARKKMNLDPPRAGILVSPLSPHISSSKQDLNRGQLDMAVYAAVLSLIHTIDQIQNHPRPPVSLDTRQVQSLYEKLKFFQNFLENYSIDDASSKDLEGLVSRIADVAYEAEDIIESHIADQNEAAKARSTTKKENISPIDLYQGLEKVLSNLDLIERDVKEIIQHKGIQLQRNYSIPTGRPPISPSMVGLDDILHKAMDKLTGQQSSRQVIPIVGMGGIGKTTLARNIYVNPLIVEHFQFRGWATIAQESDWKEILLEVFVCLNTIGSRESLSEMGEHELGEKLYKNLSGRRYLIVMDDVWSTDAWDRIKFFFPDNNNGSRIVITTRLSNLASQLSGSSGLEMGFLDEDNSWNLFRKNVFGDKDCPMELEEIGKQIARGCKGLPLSIVVIGGLLAKSNQTREHWNYILENLNSVVNLDDNERCLRILSLSYNHLPVHLKPCFLYMGIFPKDRLVKASTLVKLWVAEGFLKPINDKTMELAAEKYLKDLVRRNLVLVGELGYYGNIKLCRVHDLLRDLCIKVAEKESFFCVATTDNPNTGQKWHTQRRIGIHRQEMSFKHIPESLCKNVKSASLARSVICNVDRVAPARSPARLLRVFHRIKVLYPKYKYDLKYMFRPINLRHLAAAAWLPISGEFPPLFYHLWNLQTLIVDHDIWGVIPTPPIIDIWKMPRLRHINVYDFHLPDPPSNFDDSYILHDLQTLKTVSISEWSEEAARRIPNIKKLNLRLPYTESSSSNHYQLDNLCRLNKLESLSCSFYSAKDPLVFWGHDLAMSLVFPHTLKKLTLSRACLLWEDLAEKVGYLPNLQVLKLKICSCKGSVWETVEGQFCSLKVLEIDSWPDLEYWMMENWTHFPCLERLILGDLPNLKAIPQEIGDVPTLKSIELKYCKESLIISAKEMVKVQQEDMGNEGLLVSVVLYHKNQVVECLASPATSKLPSRMCTGT
ncbi:disease resistance protein [Striga asiatica]|uniref:Disease resistance protein n=1 Tax=Striga asiatica TaxID=4170 RepID=A0A5A7QLR1_STRAF|nr:disease resistance protein [Striga asiatica]